MICKILQDVQDSLVNPANPVNPVPYSSKFKDHLAHPRNAGELPGANAVADEKNPVCGDRLRQKPAGTSSGGDRGLATAGGDARLRGRVLFSWTVGTVIHVTEVCHQKGWTDVLLRHPISPVFSPPGFEAGCHDDTCK